MPHGVHVENSRGRILQAACSRPRLSWVQTPPAGVGLLTWRRHCTQADAACAMIPLPGAGPRLHGVVRAAPPPEPRPAIEPAPEVHLHLHGLAPEDLAVILSTVHLRDDR